MRNKSLFILVLLSVAFPNMYAAQIISLRCNYQESPNNVDDLKPRLSWQIISDRRGFVQSAYRVIVASSAENLRVNKADIWDSKIVESAQSLFIEYNGSPLASGTIYFWKVQVWDDQKKPLPWSIVSTWRMGLLNSSDWKAEWVTASKWFTPPDLRPKGLQLSDKGGWADIDLGNSTPIQEIRLFSSDDSSFPKKFKILGSDEYNFLHHQILVDQSSGDYILQPKGAQIFSFQPVRYRFIRLVVIGENNGKSTAIRQIEIYSGARNVALMKFTREYNTDWDHGHATFLVDGMPSVKEGSVCPADACPSDLAPAFRKSFYVNKKVKSATVYYAALGMARITINGMPVTREVLGPPFTDYTKRIMYVAYDVSPLIKQGMNVLGSVLGNGFFSTPSLGYGQRQNGNGPPGFILQTIIRFEDGSEQWVVTDSSWKWTRSEIVFNDIWQGYTEERRTEMHGWKISGYKDSSWAAVQKMDSPKGRLVARTGPPIKINGFIRPIKVKGNKAWFKTVSVGWPLLKLNGRTGQKITITGTGPGYSMSRLTFILAENGLTTLSPDFIIQPGPVEIKVDGLLQPLKKDDILIQYVNADLKATGSFICSNKYLNELYAVTLRTHRNYVYDFPSDPNREKQGWTQDVQNMFNTAAYLTDVRDLYQRWWNDMADNQDERGYLGSIVPMVNRQVNDWNSPWWSGMIVFLPWEHYQYYGNIEMLERSYDAMKKYVDFLARMAETGEGKNWDDFPYFTQHLDTSAAKEKMIIWNGAGDWNNPFTETQFAVPAPMTTMSAWFLFSTIVSKTAGLLGKTDDQEKYAALATDIRNRYNAKYLNQVTGLYGDSTNSQTAQILPLRLGMVPEDKSALTYQRLLEAIHARNDHIGTGFVSINYLLQTLAAHRESVLVNKMIQQSDYPGWKTLTKKGVFQETWSGGGAQMPSCGGAVGAWLFQSVLGIQPDPAYPGFKQFTLSPQPDKTTGLMSADGYYDSGYGRIKIDWKCSNNKFVANVEIPANSSAILVLPSDKPSSTTESGHTFNADSNIKMLTADQKTVTYKVKSGKYHFETEFVLND